MLIFGTFKGMQSKGPRKHQMNKIFKKQLAWTKEVEKKANRGGSGSLFCCYKEIAVFNFVFQKISI